MENLPDRMKRIEKATLLKAMRTIHKEYKENKHRLGVTTCALCQLFHHEAEFLSDSSCTLCPMTVFDAEVGCSDRRCSSLDCGGYHYNDEEYQICLKAVTEFYAEAIKVVRKMTDEQLNDGFFSFQFLKDIDERIADKYGLPEIF